MNIGGECAIYDLAAPCVAQAPGALYGDIEAPGEGHAFVRMTPRHANSTEEARVKTHREKEGRGWESLMGGGLDEIKAENTASGG